MPSPVAVRWSPVESGGVHWTPTGLCGGEKSIAIPNILALTHSEPFTFSNNVNDAAHCQHLKGIWKGNALPLDALSCDYDPGSPFFKNHEEIAVHGCLKIYPTSHRSTDKTRPQLMFDPCVLTKKKDCLFFDANLRKT